MRQMLPSMLWSRRNVLKTAGGMIAGLGVPHLGIADDQPHREAEPHFYLHVYIPFGVDATSLFDARPTAFTAAGKIHNYFGTEATEWVGNNGHKTLVRPVTDVLKPFKDDFSVINGVVMNTVFDGHDQIALAMFTGNPLGGAWFLPHLGHQMQPLDYLQVGRFSYGASITNASGGLAADGGTIQSLIKAVTGQAPGDIAEDPLIAKQWTAASLESGGQGFVAKGAAQALKGLSDAKGLVSLLRKVQIPQNGGTGGAFDTQVMIEFLKNKIATQLLYVPDLGFDIDVHAEANAKKIPENYPKIPQVIADIFKTLKSTEFSPGKSYFDVTTVVVSSEFSRTMRQNDKPIDNTGTDHNTLGNSVLIGGKGIKKGCVFGATDLDALDGKEFSGVSSYHKILDHSLLKTMGKPIDFATGLPLVGVNLPEYDSAKFLTFSNIANTIMHMFKVDPSLQWDMGRNLPKAPLLPFLLG